MRLGYLFFMNAYEQLQQASQALHSVQARENALSKDVQTLKENVSMLNKIVSAILATVPKEHLEAIKAQLDAAGK